METLSRPLPNVNKSKSDYVTVVSVGAATAAHKQQADQPRDPPADPSGFVTVLKIGDGPTIPTPKNQNVPSVNGHEDYCVEQVLVYRLPGERLGFGLKFEGGTKAAEFVKRLFIQSCAPDSPASRVRGSWGVLTEGDEVLAIDNVKVTSMTRIDCVRCLKDSNVVIKLQVRHKLSSHEDGKTEAPLVISAEKKRTPPPPPPVPPRKTPRKKDVQAPRPPQAFADNQNTQQNDIPIPQTRNIKSSSEMIIGAVINPPDAEVYLDLFSQEHEAYCLSESDDTGSSISTVVDRFGSFPTTTTSSFAGSMPSTPTAMQRRIQHTNPFDVEHAPGEELLFERLVSLQAKENQVTLQPPANFQDAPLSYADEDVRVVEAAVLAPPSPEKIKNKRRPPPPPPPRTKHLQNQEIDTNNIEQIQENSQFELVITSKSMQNEKIIETNNNDYSREDENTKMLPRLVDFVPKSTKFDGDVDNNDASKIFIEQEQMRHTDAFFLQENECELDLELNEDAGKWCEDEDDEDSYAFGWSTGQPLATIGEADNEDESLQDIDTAAAPSNHSLGDEQRLEKEIVVEEPSVDVDMVDGTQLNGKTEDSSSDEYEETQKAPEPAPRTTLKAAGAPNVEEPGHHDKMDTRQPPDGHEFPDYHQETTMSTKPAMIPRRNVPLALSRAGKDQPKTNVKDMIAMFSHADDQSQPTASQLVNGEKPTVMNLSANATAVKEIKCTYNFETTPSPMMRGSMSDLTSDNGENLNQPMEKSNLHKRSQSLVDISSPNDRWSQILDQRRRGLSKLKGLIIPEHPDVAQSAAPAAVIDLPEIKSAIDTTLEFRAPTIPAAFTTRSHHTRNNSTPTLNITTPLWNTDVDNSAKYSPAFKRKTLQVYTTKVVPKETASSSDEECRLPSADAPKSLESITSPTRSDCSFEYASMGSMGSSPSTNTVASSKITKSEDESDNDSAVSSSQSSYVSRQSPPASPNHLFDSAANRRLLKAQSVEAINRKNILASAKCRSGKDLTGSPLLIQRKFDEPESPTTVNHTEETQNIEAVTELVEEQIKCEETSITPPVENCINDNNQSMQEANETKAPRMIKPPRESRLSSEIKAKPDTDRLSSSKFYSSRNNAKPASVTDLRKNFEKSAPQSTNPTKLNRPRHSTSSITTSSTTTTRPLPTKRSSLPILPATPTKTIVKLQDKQNIIASTVKAWEDESISSTDVRVIALRPEIPGGSIGITLAGGTDYETKDITIHKVRNGSVAHRDGRLRKGERVLSINGKSMNGITHAESMAILKEPVSEVIIVTSPPRTDTPTPTTPTSRDSSRTSSTVLTSLTDTAPNTPTPSTEVILDQTDGAATTSIKTDCEKTIITVKLIKDPLSTASGLGFSMEGGRGSPQGDLPLLIKKLFTGGLADKSGMLAVGDELVQIQDANVSEMPRIDAWSLMKKLPPGEITLKVRR